MKAIYAKHLKLVIAFLLTLAINFADAQCSASFTYSVGANGLVTFSSTSTGNVNSSSFYYWAFYGGQNPIAPISGTNIPNISTTFLANGTYTVLLSVYSSPSSSCTTAQIVTVNTSPCNLNASFSYTQGPNGVVNFNSVSTNTVSNTTYSWNFDDGGSSSLASPSHVYANNGTYMVTLTANNNFTPACVFIYTAAITVTSVASSTCNLVANFTYTQNINGLNNGYVNFNSISTGTTSNTIYSWSYGDGGAGNTVSPSHVYATTGTYIVTLTANNNFTPACVSVYTAAITISSTTCNASFNYSVGSNGNVTFTAIPSSTTVANYYWHFYDMNNNIWIGQNSFTTPITVYSFTANGTYSITLDVTYSSPSCLASAYGLITVSTVPTPTSCNLNTNFTYTTGANGMCYFNNTTTGAPAGTTYSWSFGDGTSSTLNSPSHTYVSNGTYWVMLLANANSTANPNCIDTTGHSVVISNITNTCIANTTFSLVPTGSAHSWYAVVTNTGNVAAAQWTWGDSTATSFGIVTSHTYAAAGNYNICLTVTTTCGTIGTHCSSQYLNKTNGESADIIYINCITPDMLPTGIKNNSATLISCIISPNPNNGEFNVNASGINSSSAKIQVYNLVGEIMFENVADINNASINKNIKLENIANGVYFIKLNVGDKIHTQKLIINR